MGRVFGFLEINSVRKKLKNISKFQKFWNFWIFGSWTQTGAWHMIVPFWSWNLSDTTHVRSHTKFQLIWAINTAFTRGGLNQPPPLLNAVFMAQTSWNFVCDLTWVVSERFHDQKGTIMCQAPGWVQDPKIQKFQEFWNSDIFFIFFVQNWLPRTQRPFPLNSWWKNGPFWCKNHCSSSKTVDFSIFSGGARKKVGPLGGPLSAVSYTHLTLPTKRIV